MWLLAPIAARAGFDPVTPAELALGGEKSCGGSFLDLEGDGDWDLVAPADDEIDGVRLLRNDGAIDAWTDLTASNAPALLEGQEVRGLLPADLTNDGWTDLVRVGLREITIFVNSGPPDFTLDDAARFADPSPNYEGAAILDADDDGWLDVLVTGAEVANWILFNPADGTAAFVTVDQGPFGLVQGSNSDFVTVGDWNADGRTDVVIRGEGTGPDTFLATANGWEAVPGFDLDARNDAKGAVALCDLRGTGALDLYWSTPDVPAVSAFAWDFANERWDPGSVTGPDLIGVHSLTCGDLDNDGDIDLWLSDDDADDLLLGPDLGFGSGDAGITDTVATALADLDADGDLDAYQVNDFGPNVLLENDQNDDDWLRVRLRANVAACPDAPVLRDDIGGSVRVLDTADAPVTSRIELSGGMGRGQVGWPVLHIGGVDPGVAHHLAVDFRYGGAAEVILQVPAGTHDLVVVSDDPDGDGVADVHEREPIDDMDGDGFVARLDDDTDGDGFSDRDERGPGGPCDLPRDTDGDGDADFLDLDSDGDGVADPTDLDPLDSDFDDDGLSDGDEILWGTDPTRPDTDGDGLDDGQEVEDGTDPTVAEPVETAPGPVSGDADGDGIPDASDPDPGDAGGSAGAGPPGPEFGCGCGSAPTDPHWTALAGLWVLVSRRRRRTGS